MSLKLDAHQLLGLSKHASVSCASTAARGTQLINERQSMSMQAMITSLNEKGSLSKRGILSVYAFELFRLGLDNDFYKQFH